VDDKHPAVSALCVARHPILSDHIARFFSELGVSTEPVVGLAEAMKCARHKPPDVVICDYELLAASSLEAWEQDDLLSRTAVIAVSLTRRPHEAHLLDVNSIAGFLYLPTLDRSVALRTLRTAAEASRRRYAAPPTTTSPANALTTELQAR